MYSILGPVPLLSRGFIVTMVCQENLNQVLENFAAPLYVTYVSASRDPFDFSFSHISSDITLGTPLLCPELQCKPPWLLVCGVLLTSCYTLTIYLDTHIHASQYPNCGVFGKTTLLDWLNKYTFPLESSLSDTANARKVYSRCISRTLSHGTTTAAYFATTHVSSTNILAEVCLEKGQRAFVGRCNMDSDMHPSYYKDASPSAAVADTRATIEHIASIDPLNSLVTPIITPRFAPSCTASLLSELGALHKETNYPIQTHVSENPSEIALVAKLFPDCVSYADVYDTHGLLTPRTVLAHGVHLTPDERILIKQRRSKVSHCPVSNTSISSGLCPVRTLLDDGIDVGLGTDVSGGYSASILVAAREAAMVSRTIAALTPEDEDKDRQKMSVEECLYLATKGGAKCLGLESKVGAFEVGMRWDAQMVQLASADEDAGEGMPTEDEGLVELWGGETWDEKLAKWMFCGDDRNTKKVWVNGRLVHER